MTEPQPMHHDGIIFHCQNCFENPDMPSDLMNVSVYPDGTMLVNCKICEELVFRTKIDTTGISFTCSCCNEDQSSKNV